MGVDWVPRYPRGGAHNACVGNAEDWRAKRGWAILRDRRYWINLLGSVAVAVTFTAIVERAAFGIAFLVLGIVVLAVVACILVVVWRRRRQAQQTSPAPG